MKRILAYCQGTNLLTLYAYIDSLFDYSKSVNIKDHFLELATIGVAGKYGLLVGNICSQWYDNSAKGEASGCI